MVGRLYYKGLKVLFGNEIGERNEQEDNAEIPKEYISKLFEDSSEEFKKLDE